MAVDYVGGNLTDLCSAPTNERQCVPGATTYTGTFDAFPCEYGHSGSASDQLLPEAGHECCKASDDGLVVRGDQDNIRPRGTLVMHRSAPGRLKEVYRDVWRFEDDVAVRRDACSEWRGVCVPICLETSRKRPTLGIVLNVVPS